MNSRVSIFAAGFMIVFGIYNLRLGIRARKRSDIALGVISMLGGGALGVMMVVGESESLKG